MGVLQTNLVGDYQGVAAVQVFFHQSGILNQLTWKPSCQLCFAFRSCQIIRTTHR